MARAKQERRDRSEISSGLFPQDKPTRWVWSPLFPQGGNFGPQKSSGLSRVAEQSQPPAPPIWPRAHAPGGRGQGQGASGPFPSGPAHGVRGTWGQALCFLWEESETDLAAESRGYNRLPDHNGLCLSLPTCKRMGLITCLPPMPTSEGAVRVNYCLAIPGALMKGGGKWALLTWAGNLLPAWGRVERGHTWF